MATVTFYHILETTHTASFTELKKAYFQQAKACHPDVNDGNPAKEEQFKRLVAAFEVLSDPLKRRDYDATLKAAQGAAIEVDQLWTPIHHDAIMDNVADDILEELIVGNYVPPFATFQTLMLDLKSTENFVMFREAKTAFYNNQIQTAYKLLARLVTMSTSNILYHYYLARSAERLQMYGRASQHYRTCLKIGARRSPPQQLHRVHQHLHRLRLQRGLMGKVMAWLNPPEGNTIIDSERQMIDEMNRSMARLLNDQNSSGRKKNKRLLGSGRRRR